MPSEADSTALTSGAPRPRVRARSSQPSNMEDELPSGDIGVPGLAASIAHHQQAHQRAQHQQQPHVRRRYKARSWVRRFRSYATRHTWIGPLIILSLFAALYAVNPTDENPISHFIFLSYKVPPSAAPAHGLDAQRAIPATDLRPQYSKGRWDFAFVFFWTIVLSFSREFLMQEVLRPYARRSGVTGRGKQARFMEQGYAVFYFGLVGPAGLWVMSRTPAWYFNTRGMYEGFPHKTHEAAVKFYYLFQAAYWSQQAIVLLLGMEKPRKDFRELVCHHIVTLSLIWSSYRYHFTYMGLAVYITHDISDFFLASSKILNYLKSPFMAPYFFVFVCSWIYCRHYLNLCLLWSMAGSKEFKTIGPYELNWETEQYKSELAFWIAFPLMTFLQFLNFIWLYYIVRIGYRFIVDKTAEDDRSEGDEDDIAEAQKELEDEKRRLLADNPPIAVSSSVDAKNVAVNF